MLRRKEQIRKIAALKEMEKKLRVPMLKKRPRGFSNNLSKKRTFSNRENNNSSFDTMPQKPLFHHTATRNLNNLSHHLDPRSLMINNDSHPTTEQSYEV